VPTGCRAGSRTGHPGESYPNLTIDFYHHYKEDMALMAEMGFKSFRTSVPGRGSSRTAMKQHQTKRVGFLNDLFDDLQARHRTRRLLSHFEMPWHLVKTYGGFRNRDASLSSRFAEACFTATKIKSPTG
jgi:6-phospho-beta-glucosidase